MTPVAKRRIFLGGLGLIGAMLTACADTKQMASDYHDADAFGHAVREDLEAQIVNPNPTWPGAPPKSSGARAALAQTKYQSDSVTKPVGLVTTAGTGGGAQ